MKMVVGMSGGVDSSMAGLILKEQGYDVVGITLKVWPTECGRLREDICCDSRGIASAREVARRIGISHRVIDVQTVFRRRVVSYFCREYGMGRTPNPCVRCNAEVKFGELLQFADEIGAPLVATGHYARLEKHGGRVRLLRGIDAEKDQAYFLSRVPQRYLRRLIFPLGKMRKETVRERAVEKGLGGLHRPESQEICFVAGRDYRDFIREALGKAIRPGAIIDSRGEVIGTHPGIEYFTVGQRSGLKISSNQRRYVISIDPLRRTLRVGAPEDLLRSECRLTDVNWITQEGPPGPLRALVKIRYTHHGVMSTIYPEPGGGARVRFDEPQKAVSPGQAAVFYDGDIVLGGGWIE